MVFLNTEIEQEAGNWFSVVTMCVFLFLKNIVLWFPSFPFCSFPLGVHMQYCHSLYLYAVWIFLHTGDVNTFASIGTLEQKSPKSLYKQKWNEEGWNRWDNKWSEDRRAHYVRHFGCVTSRHLN